MFPNTQMLAACEVPMGCSTEERQERGCVCASVLRRGEGCETCSQYPNASASPALPFSIRTRSTHPKAATKKKPKPNPGGCGRRSAYFPHDCSQAAPCPGSCRIPAIPRGATYLLLLCGAARPGRDARGGERQRGEKRRHGEAGGTRRAAGRSGRASPPPHLG